MTDHSEELGNVGDLLFEILTFCYSDEHRKSLEQRAQQMEITFEQCVAWAMASAVFDRFLILPKDLPGIPKPGRPVERVRAVGHHAADDSPFPLFISYRLNDSRPYAERMFDTLRVEFGANAIFKDSTAMPLGDDYRIAIRRIVEECKAVIVVIGTQWLAVQAGKNSSRLFQPDDTLRLEIEAALDASKPIIPVLIGGAAQPKSDELPPSIHGILRYTFWTVRSDPDYDTDMDRLIQSCRACLAPDARFTPMLIPHLPVNSRLPVRVLAGSAFYVRSLFCELAKGSPIEDIMEKHGELLVRCEKVIDHWCGHFGIPENDEERL